MDLRVKIRNDSVVTKMQQKYRQLTKDEYELPVYCVANKDYTTYLLGYDKTESPKMSMKATNIQQLRDYLYSLPARGKMNALNHYCNGSLQTFLYSLEMTCSTSKIQRREELLQKLKEAEQVGIGAQRCREHPAKLS